ncbi:hypothetical protein AVEN_245793-1 [Araneus ventricosus]|uniref:Uncharacterized protein n=1 Tax=Araneus ventricosus TaxID=182803 RepID=A0A4Y2EEA8_ARAVE|nr:hypothetical protein AVEN_245793-1 [Araneus ventricosus]
MDFVSVCFTVGTSRPTGKDATQHNPIHVLTSKNTYKGLLERGCLRVKTHGGRMAIQAGKSATSCPQLVPNPINCLRGCYLFSSNIPLAWNSKSMLHLVGQRLLQLWWNWHHTSLKVPRIECLCQLREASAKLNKNGRKGVANKPRLQACVCLGLSNS